MKYPMKKIIPHSRSLQVSISRQERVINPVPVAKTHGLAVGFLFCNTWPLAEILCRASEAGMLLAPSAIGANKFISLYRGAGEARH